jgi:PAS domain S-box-containing protein
MKNLKDISALVTRIASLITIVVGFLVIYGWIFNIPLFKSVIPGITSMKFNSANCFVLAGIAMYILDGRLISPRFRLIAKICSWGILIIGLLTLSEYIFGWNIGIDELLMKGDAKGINTSSAGRMSLTNSINFIAISIIFLRLIKKQYFGFIKALMLIIIFSSALVVFNHLFGYSFLKYFYLLDPTALHSAILFILLSIGILYRRPLKDSLLSYKEKLAVFFTIILLMVMVIFFAVDRNRSQANETAKLVEHSYDELYLSQKIISQADELQIQVNSFVNTGDPAKLSQFYSKANQIDKDFNLYKSLKADDPNMQREQIDSIKTQIDKYISFLKNVINANEDEGLVGFQKNLIDGEGMLIIDRVRSIISTIEQEDNETMAKRKSENLESIHNSTKIIVIFQGIIILILIISFSIIYTNTKLRNRVEQSLKSSNKDLSDYRHALDESSLISMTDENGIIMNVNDNFCKVSKYSRQELIGQKHSILNSGYHPKEFFKNLWDTISQGEIWHGETRNKAKDGTYYWLDNTIVPFLNKEGKPYMYISIRKEITDLKNALENLEVYTDDLKNSNIELEHFAYAASHDLQEPLRMVSSFLNLLEKRLDGQLDETNRQYINFAVDGAERMKSLILALLEYSRVGTNKEDFTSVDFNEVAQYVTLMLEENIKENSARVILKQLPVVKANKTLITHLLVNLVQNALKYHNGKQIEIEIGSIENPDKYIIYVKDNGIGIDPKFSDKIFVIFQRLHTKKEYSGTGIGLAICKRIAEIHKGKIWVESEADKGSTFYFSIPKNMT